MWACPWNGSAWCSQSELNAMGPSMIWPSSASGSPPASVGKAVNSFGSPSYPTVASYSARTKRSGVAPVEPPEQEAARPPLLVEVADDSPAVRLDPFGERLQARVDFADCLVAEVEEVGVEERQVVVRLVGSGHVGADVAAVALRM